MKTSSHHKKFKYGSGALPITTIWEKEMPPYKPNWDWIWESIPTMSKNPAHQFIHFKLIPKAYATQYVLHRMKRLPKLDVV